MLTAWFVLTNNLSGLHGLPIDHSCLSSNRKVAIFGRSSARVPDARIHWSKHRMMHDVVVKYNSMFHLILMWWTGSGQLLITSAWTRRRVRIKNETLIHHYNPCELVLANLTRKRVMKRTESLINLYRLNLESLRLKKSSPLLWN